MDYVSIEVSIAEGAKTYLPVGATLRAIHRETGEPLDLVVALDRGQIIVHEAELAPPVEA